MKKIMIFAIIFLSIILGSCEYLVKYDITVKNNCGFEIGVYITPTTSSPSAYIDLNYSNNNTQKFSSLDYGSYYLHVRDRNHYNLFDDRYHSYVKLNVYKNEVWTVRWDGTAYIVDLSF